MPIRTLQNAGLLLQEVCRHLRPHTLRAKYGENKVQNGVHCTDLPEDGSLEVSVITFWEVGRKLTRVFWEQSRFWPIQTAHELTKQIEMRIPHKKDKNQLIRNRLSRFWSPLVFEETHSQNYPMAFQSLVTNSCLVNGPQPNSRFEFAARGRKFATFCTTVVWWREQHGDRTQKREGVVKRQKPCWGPMVICSKPVAVVIRTLSPIFENSTAFTELLHIGAPQWVRLGTDGDVGVKYRGGHSRPR